MKQVITFFIYLAFSTVLVANTENNTNAKNCDNVAKPKGELQTENKLTSEVAAESQEEIIHVIDSNYYAVNKFNFLFYILYKTHYMPKEQRLEVVPIN